MTSIRLAAGIARRNGSILLVASRYPNHREPLWNLPGGRVEAGELYHETVVREVREETGLHARVTRMAYVNESYDGATHVMTVAFEIDVEGTIALPQANDHVVDACWCDEGELRERLEVAVVRDPLLDYLATGTQYFATHDAGITIRWGD